MGAFSTRRNESRPGRARRPLASPVAEPAAAGLKMAAAGRAFGGRRPGSNVTEALRVMAQHDQLLEEHRQTFHSFVKLATYGTIFVALVLAVMALTLL